MEDTAELFANFGIIQIAYLGECDSKMFFKLNTRHLQTPCFAVAALSNQTVSITDHEGNLYFRILGAFNEDGSVLAFLPADIYIGTVTNSMMEDNNSLGVGRVQSRTGEPLIREIALPDGNVVGKIFLEHGKLEVIINVETDPLQKTLALCRALQIILTECTCRYQRTLNAIALFLSPAAYDRMCTRSSRTVQGDVPGDIPIPLTTSVSNPYTTPTQEQGNAIAASESSVTVKSLIEAPEGDSTNSSLQEPGNAIAAPESSVTVDSLIEAPEGGSTSGSLQEQQLREDRENRWKQHYQVQLQAMRQANKAERFPTPVCPIDGSPTVRSYFSSYCCMGCSGFFHNWFAKFEIFPTCKRTTAERCTIKIRSRNNCNACRLEACIEAGLKVPNFRNK